MVSQPTLLTQRGLDRRAERRGGAAACLTPLIWLHQEIERRRGMMRQRAQERKTEEMEVMELEDEGRSGEESESESEYEEYTDSEDEMEPRLKPVFIRKYVTQPCGSDAGAEG